MTGAKGIIHCQSNIDQSQSKERKYVRVLISVSWHRKEKTRTYIEEKEQEEKKNRTI